MARTDAPQQTGLLAGLLAERSALRRRVSELERLRAERDAREQEIRRSEETQAALNAFLRDALDDTPLDGHLARVLDRIVSIPWLTLESKGAVFVADQSSCTLTMKVHRGLAEPLLEMCRYVRFGLCLCGRAAASREIQFPCCVDENHDNRHQGMEPHGHYCVPIVSGARVLGVLNLRVREGHAHCETEERFLRATADVLASIIEHKQDQAKLKNALARLQRTAAAVIDAIAATIETRDPYTAGHQRRVARLAQSIAAELHLPPDGVDGTRVAAAIHDLGKISVPSEILSKSAPLSRVEFELIKTHPGVGYNILKPIEFDWPVPHIVLQHHERMDGSGYPAGLKGDQIMMEARIIAVADVVEAMASHRPSRPALGIEQALGGDLQGPGNPIRSRRRRRLPAALQGARIRALGPPRLSAAEVRGDGLRRCLRRRNSVRIIPARWLLPARYCRPNLALSKGGWTWARRCKSASSGRGASPERTFNT